MARKRFLLLAVLFLALFVALTAALKFVDVTSPLREDPQKPELGTMDFGTDGNVGLSTVNIGVFKALGTSETFDKLSDLVMVFAIGLGLIFGLVWLVQIFKYRRFTGVDTELYLLALLYVVTLALYVIFEKVNLNGRPVAQAVGEQLELEASFPSSHVLLIVAMVGSACLFLRARLRSQMLRRVVIALSVVLMAGGTVGRLLSGQHWFTDVAAAVLLGLSLIFFYEAAAWNHPRRALREEPAPRHSGRDEQPSYQDPYTRERQELDRMARDYGRPSSRKEEEELRDPLSPARK